MLVGKDDKGKDKGNCCYNAAGWNNPLDYHRLESPCSCNKGLEEVEGLLDSSYHWD